MTSFYVIYFVQCIVRYWLSLVMRIDVKIYEQICHKNCENFYVTYTMI